MIAKTTSAPSFFPLAAYLQAGADGHHSERVAWTAGRNIVTPDLDVAPAIMQATAALSTQVEKPVYHLVVSFDVADAPTRAQMEHVADRVLARLGLAEHQAVLVAHNDTLHAHVHCMVNRVHPVTGAVWDRWQDRALIEEALREVERDLHMRQVPGLLAEHQQSREHVPPSLSDDERRHAEHLRQPPLLDRARALVPELRAARTWTEFDAVLARGGLGLEPRGGGLAIGDGETRVSASRVHPGLSRLALEQRFHDRYDGTAPPHVAALAHDLASLRELRALEKVAAEAHHALLAAEWGEGAIARETNRVNALGHELDRRLQSIYLDPASARLELDARARTRGAGRAADTLATNPEDLGSLRTVPVSRALGLLRIHDDAPAREEARALSVAAHDYLRAREVALGPAGLADARSVLDQARDRVATSRRELNAHRESQGRDGDATAAGRAIGLALGRLLPRELAQLQRLIGSPEIALAMELKHQAHALLFEQDRGPAFHGT